MNCIKCNALVSGADIECPSCGVILAKAKVPPAADAPPLLPAVPAIALASVPSSQDLPASFNFRSTTELDGETVEALLSVRSWLKFVVIYGFVVAIVMLLGALVLMMLSGSNPGLAVFGFVYLLYGFVFLAMLAPLERSSKALQGISADTVGASLQSFVRDQCVFWRRVGIVSAITLGIAILGFLVALVIPIFLSATRH